MNGVIGFFLGIVIGLILPKILPTKDNVYVDREDRG